MFELFKKPPPIQRHTKAGSAPAINIQGQFLILGYLNVPTFVIEYLNYLNCVTSLKQNIPLHFATVKEISCVKRIFKSYFHFALILSLKYLTLNTCLSARTINHVMLFIYRPKLLVEIDIKRTDSLPISCFYIIKTLMTGNVIWLCCQVGFKVWIHGFLYQIMTSLRIETHVFKHIAPFYFWQIFVQYMLRSNIYPDYLRQLMF